MVKTIQDKQLTDYCLPLDVPQLCDHPFPGCEVTGWHMLPPYSMIKMQNCKLCNLRYRINIIVYVHTHFSLKRKKSRRSRCNPDPNLCNMHLIWCNPITKPGAVYAVETFMIHFTKSFHSDVLGLWNLLCEALVCGKYGLVLMRRTELFLELDPKLNLTWRK